MSAVEQNPHENTADEDQVPVLLSAARVQPSETVMKFLPTQPNGRKEVTFVWGESCCGQKKDGPQSAPPLVCSEKFLEQLHTMEWQTKVKRCPQVFKATPASAHKCADDTGHTHIPFSVAATCDTVASDCLEAHSRGSFPLMIGGDHCLSMGSVAATAAHYKGEFGLIWFDAHADINTPLTSPSGNMHGMPIAALIGLPGMDQVPGFEDKRFANVRPDRIAWIGLRDVDDGEYETIAELGIKTAYDMNDLKKHGMKKIVQMALAAINPEGKLPIHLSFDVDGMDPIDAPSTGTAVGDGVRIHEALELVRTLRESGNLAAMDVVEVNPSLGTANDMVTTVTNAQLVIAHALGACR